jgi:hypothetical protein
MMGDSPKKPAPASDEAQRLSAIRHALVALHKSLVDYDRVRYEQTIGSISSPSQFLDLLMRDPWFAWLHPLSELIVSIAQALEDKQPLTPAMADALVKQASLLLAPSETGDGFGRHYFEALQSEPDAVLAHAEAMRLIRKRKEAA